MKSLTSFSNFCSLVHSSLSRENLIRKSAGFTNSAPYSLTGATYGYWNSANRLSGPPSILNLSGSEKHKLVAKSVNYKIHAARWNSIEANRQPIPSLPQLTKFPEILWPSLIKTLKNYMLEYLIIRPYLDSHFQIKDFVRGAKKALVCVSQLLSRGHLDHLTNLLTPDCLAELRMNFKALSLQQQLNLAVACKDICQCFPYELGIILPRANDNKNFPKFLEITMCYHVIPGLRNMETELTLRTLQEMMHRITICNYRFIREYTEHVNDEGWFINRLNHFQPYTLDSFQPPK